ncbi:MAG: transcriptional regulator domain-containing protein [Sphingomonas sp.]
MGATDGNSAQMRLVEACVAMTVDWRSDDAYRGLRAAGRSALAWEVLRRDPDYPSAARAAATILPEAAPDAFVARWGLYFRGRPGQAF